MIIKNVSTEEAAGADVVICIEYRAEEGLLLSDNILDRCHECGTRIQLRPDVPLGPKRICVPCAVTILGEVLDDEPET